MKLPLINRSHRKTDLENSQAIKEAFNPFLAQLEKVIEVRIFLKFTFHKTDIDDEFIKDIEDEYAYQFLTKMEFLPTKEHKLKLLKIRPIEKCDFHLSIETVRDKQVKVIHVYPNGSNLSLPKEKPKNKLKSFLTNEDFDKLIQKNQYHIQKKKDKDNTVSIIQNRQLKPDDVLLFNREKVDNLISLAKDDIIDKQLYAQSNGGVKIDMSIQSIREKYLTPSSNIMVQQTNEDKLTNVKGKLSHISTIKKRNILTESKYKFPLLNVNHLNQDILEEIMQPIDVPVEIIMKDVNYILDNFPIDELIDLDNNNNASSSIIINNKFKCNVFHKIKSVSKQNIIFVYKHLQNKDIYRIIGLCINLIYWVVFGNFNRIQIDQVTKQFMYIKLLKEIRTLQDGFTDKTLCNKIFLPLLILIVRIECENVFSRKLTKLFNCDNNSKQVAFNKINEFITAIFDPHCYFNTFALMGGNAAIIKHKYSKSILPKYKEKKFATSNLLDQVFIVAENDNEKNANKKGVIGVNAHSVDENNDKAKFIMNEKVSFFADLLERVNRNLKKRNLEPIFTTKDPGVKRRIVHSNSAATVLEGSNSSTAIASCGGGFGNIEEDINEDVQNSNERYN